MLQVALPVFLSSKPSSPWPAAPWLPMNERASVEARQTGDPDGVVVVCEVVVAEVVVADVVTVTVCVGVVTAALVVLFELPHAATASARHGSSTIFAQRMVWGSVGHRELLPGRPSRPTATIARMSRTSQSTPRRRRRSVVAPLIAALNGWSPFWAPQLVVAGAIALQFVLPEKLTIGPSWLLPGVEALLLIVLVFTSPHKAVRHSPLRRHVAIGLIALVSAVNVFSLFLLTHHLLHGHLKNGPALMFSGVALWGTNVLLFALWYYEVDRGGPLARRLGEAYEPDFLFATMTTEGEQYQPGWTPGMSDYLYLSLTNASAFSPTDTMPLTATAKWLMATQSLISLWIVILVVARAVNIVS